MLATLWSVADQSTGLFMRELYRRRTAQGLTKVMALRATQRAFLSGEIAGPADEARGKLVPVSPAGGPAEPHAANDYRHPYCWAPIIRMGNWL